MSKRKREEDFLGINCIVKEDLPYPYVYYPDSYGTFFVFARDLRDMPSFCACSKPLIETYLDLYPAIKAPLDGNWFPHIIEGYSHNNPNKFMQTLHFEEGLCHRCNLKTPTLEYCVPMYGGQFKRKYGWYIRQTELRLGIKRIPAAYILSSQYYSDEELTPDYIKEKIIQANKYFDYLSDRNKYLYLSSEEYMQHPKPLSDDIDPYSEIPKIIRQIENDIENITRQEFGFKKIGEGWVSETLLYKIICHLFPNEEVLFHHRPKWLNGLELDIYLPQLKIAFEYQGQQHYHPIKIWGGEEALKKLQNRDKTKATICEELKIKLYHIKYSDPLNEEFIKSLIK